jgi:hypothetical protein
VGRRRLADLLVVGPVQREAGRVELAVRSPQLAKRGLAELQVAAGRVQLMRRVSTKARQGGFTCDVVSRRSDERRNFSSISSLFLRSKS